MSEIPPQGTAVPPQPPVAPDQVLSNLRALVGEHFDDYLVVVSKNGDVFTIYKSKCAAFGMASMVAQDINHAWWTNRSDKI